jgi:hypothetical protein
MQVIPFIFILVIIISCSDEEKYHFISKVIINQDSIETYLKEAKFGTKRFNHFLNEEPEKKSAEINHIKDLCVELKKGYSFYSDRFTLSKIAGYINMV